MKPTHIYAEVLEDEALAQFTSAMDSPYVVSGALMPDAHTGYTLPIGAVVAVKDHICPAFVGYDIGCGMCAVKLDITELPDSLEAIRDSILAAIPVGTARHSTPQQYAPSNFLTPMTFKHLQDVGLYQLGTLGGGNHFIEIGKGNDNHIWVIIHSGSRNLGHFVASHYMERAAQQAIDFTAIATEFLDSHQDLATHNPNAYQLALEKHRSKVKPNLEAANFIEAESYLGMCYREDMITCLQCALANRKLMIDRIVSILDSPAQLLFINRNHNHAEFKDGLWIHRKGATHAELGMLGVIPGNMRDGSFIVEGKGNPDSLCSSSHGAGRVLSRKEALAALDLADFNSQMTGIVTNHTSSTLDEAPTAYKSIFEVMELQKDLVTIIDHVKPILNIKG